MNMEDQEETEDNLQEEGEGQPQEEKTPEELAYEAALAFWNQRADDVIAMAETTNRDVHIFQYDDVVMFHPVLPCVEQALTFTEKNLKCDKSTGFMSKIVYEQKSLVERVVRGCNEVGVADQGFLRDILQALVLDRRTFKVTDMRVSVAKNGTFPYPQLNLMHGFRFSQKQLLTDFLTKDCSGLLGAVTRYGKTRLMINTLRAFPDLTTVVTAPGVDLVKQLYADIKAQIPDREVKLICTGRSAKFSSENGITVCSVDSLDKVNKGAVQLLLADEPHALVTPDRADSIRGFHKARRYGYGATLKGRFDGRDRLIYGLFGPVLVERTYKEAVAEGAICPLEIIMYKVQLNPGKKYRDRRVAYNDLFFHNQSMADLTRQICEEVIPADWQTMVFVKDEKQADMWLDTIGHEHTIAMAKKMTVKQREEVDRLMKENIIKRCLCTKIYVQGVTFSDVRVLVNCEAGGNNTSAIQKPGRLAEIRPNKKCGVVIDIMFEPAPGVDMDEARGNAWYDLCKDSNGRLKAYKEKGYGLHTVYSIEELKKKFNQLAV